MRYQIEYCPNPNVVEIHVTFRVPRFNFMLEVDDEPDVRHLDEEDRVLVRDLLDIPGVESVWSSKYSVTVQKGTLFEWPSITDQAVEVLRKRFAPKSVAVKVSA